MDVAGLELLGSYWAANVWSAGDFRIGFLDHPRDLGSTSQKEASVPLFDFPSSDRCNFYRHLDFSLLSADFNRAISGLPAVRARALEYDSGSTQSLDHNGNLVSVHVTDVIQIKALEDAGSPISNGNTSIRNRCPVYMW